MPPEVALGEFRPFRGTPPTSRRSAGETTTAAVGQRLMVIFLSGRYGDSLTLVPAAAADDDNDVDDIICFYTARQIVVTMVLQSCTLAVNSKAI